MSYAPLHLNLLYEFIQGVSVLPPLNCTVELLLLHLDMPSLQIDGAPVCVHPVFQAHSNQHIEWLAVLRNIFMMSYLFIYLQSSFTQ